MPAMSGATAASAILPDSSSRTSSRSATCTHALAGAQREHAPAPSAIGCVLKPAASGANGASGAEAERTSSRAVGVAHLERDLGLVVVAERARPGRAPPLSSGARQRDDDRRG